MPKVDYNRAELERLLTVAQEKQTEYWDALKDLESELGSEFDGDDISTWSVDSLIALAENEDEESEDDTDCTCADRSWYGPRHDSACALTGRREKE